MAGIYLKLGDSYVKMIEAPFSGESDLQALIAQHPEVLVDEDAGQVPLLLIRREAPVSDEEDASGRWSLDHLYVDAAGVPTLVEVKRSSDTRGRREVVAQMLDYAANAKLSFDVARLTTWLEQSCEGQNAEEALLEVLGVDDADAFWDTVASNLEDERFRLIFVSDAILPELRQIIEFLNGQMTRTDVLAIEVKQYMDVEGRHQTIVPRLIGNTEAAKRTKRTRSASSAPTDRTGLLAVLARRDPQEAEVAEALLDWADDHPNLCVRWNRAGDICLANHNPGLLRIWGQGTYEGTVEIKVDTLRKFYPGWDDDDRVERLMRRIEEIEGVRLRDTRMRWPKTPLAPLADPAKRKVFVEIIDGIVAGLRSPP